MIEEKRKTLTSYTEKKQLGANKLGESEKQKAQLDKELKEILTFIARLYHSGYRAIAGEQSDYAGRIREPNRDVHKHDQD